MKARSQRKSKARQLFSVVIAMVVVILIGLSVPRVYHFVGGVLMSPIHIVNQWYQTSEDTLPALLRDKSELEKQNKVLQNDLAIAQGQNVTLERLRDENERLRSLLGDNDSTRTMATVIGRPNELPYDLLQIDRGSEAGVKKDALVFLGEDRLIGRVVEVRSTYSFVELFTTPGVEMTGFISGPDVVVTVEGVGGGVARARVPQGIPLRVGDIVYVPTTVPAVFGQIVVVENRPSQPEQFGYITFPISLQSILEVAVSDQIIEPMTVASIAIARDSIVADRWLVEEANTGTFEELLATSSPTTTSNTE